MASAKGIGRLRDPQHGGIFFRFMFLLAFLAMMVVLYLVRGPVLRLAGNFWVVDDPPGPSDAIVMLGDDNYAGDRAAHAAELFKAGWAPHVVASGRYLRPYATISELEAHDLASHGVPQSAIVLFAHQATDTHDECFDIGKLMAQRGWQKIILVTSTYHTRRSRYTCERLLPPGSVLRMSAARDSEFDPNNWWHSREGMKTFFHETVAIFVAMWELRHEHVQTAESAGLLAPDVPDLPVAGLSPRAGPIGLHPRISVL